MRNLLLSNGWKGRTRAAGTSLIEILVSIVVLVIGILAIAQIFPGGIRVLNGVRNSMIGASLAESMQNTISEHPESVPDQILPVSYMIQSGVLAVVPTAAIGPKSLEIAGDAISSTGITSKLGVQYGHWDYFSGANNLRRVIGDTYLVPQAQEVGAGLRGSLLVLRYGPRLAVSNPLISSQTFKPLLEVMSGELEIREGRPTAGNNPLFAANLVNANDQAAELWLPTDQFNAFYRIRIAYFAKDSGTTVTRREATYDLPVTPSGTLGTFQTIPLQALLAANGGLGVGETLQSVEVDSLHINRKFIETAGAFTDGNPYEFKVVGNPQLGLILLNPAGANSFEERSGGRKPLMAKVSYDVFDWRIVKEEIRVPETSPFVARVSLALKVEGGTNADRTLYKGLNVGLANYDAGSSTVGEENRSTALIDLVSGAIVAPNSYNIVGRDSLIEFKDVDGSVTGLQVWEIRPDGGAIKVNPSGRTFRVYYRSANEFSIHPIKASSTYGQGVNPPKSSQYFLDKVAGPTRLYFPQGDAGQRVSIQELWYTTQAGGLRSLSSADFVLRSDSSDTVGYPFLDIRDVVTVPASNTAEYPKEFNTTAYGYAVRGVKGSSLTIRVVQNATSFGLTSDPTQNLANFNTFKDRYTSVTMEGYTQGGSK